MLTGEPSTGECGDGAATCVGSCSGGRRGAESSGDVLMLLLCEEKWRSEMGVIGATNSFFFFFFCRSMQNAYSISTTF
jgi:hypothetical protein